MKLKISVGMAACSLTLAAFLVGPAFGQETKKYTYDAKGRLVKVEHSGSVNSGVRTEYELDKAGNRKKVKKTGA